MYQLGKKISDEGIWIEYEGAKLLVGRAGSDAALSAREKLTRPYKRKMDRGTLSPQQEREVNLSVLAEAILLDWKNVQDEDGVPIAYTAKLGVTALKQDPDMLDVVVETSIENENYRIKQKEVIAKKSSKLSTG